MRQLDCLLAVPACCGTCHGACLRCLPAVHLLECYYALLSIHIMALLVLLFCALPCLLAMPVCRAFLLYVCLLVALACKARLLCLLAADLPVVHPLMEPACLLLPTCRIHLRCLAMAPLVCPCACLRLRSAFMPVFSCLYA